MTSNERRWTTWGCALLALFLTGCPASPPDDEPTPSPVPTEMGVTVRLVESTGSDPEKPEMSASVGPDHIRWSNETSKDRTIHFTADWPFLETSADFVVPAGKKSAWYSLDPSKVSGGGKPFPYEITDPLTSPGEAPDEPSISGMP